MGRRYIFSTVILVIAVFFVSVFSAPVHASEEQVLTISSFKCPDRSDYYFEYAENDDIESIIDNFPYEITAYDINGNQLSIPVNWDLSYSDDSDLIFVPVFDRDIYPLSNAELQLDIPRMQLHLKDNEILSVDSSVTFDDLNEDDVFLKQEEKSTCTLCAAAMLVRRAAMLNGNCDWNKVTESSMKSVAWLPGTGLYHTFTYAGISIGSKTAEIDDDFLKDYLADHPEGIVIYNYNKPHAILVTDFRDGEFYCADPSNGSPKGRIKISKASMGIKGCTRYWYVSSPENLKLIDDPDDPDNDDEDGISSPSDNKSPQNGSTSDNTLSNNRPSDSRTVRTGDFCISYNSAIPFSGNKTTLANFGKMTVSYNGQTYPVDKIKLNKKKGTFQIKRLKGAAKAVNKQIQKATKGSSALSYTVAPYYVSASSDLIVKYKKNSSRIKRIYIRFGNNNKYKVRKSEYSLSPSGNTIVFDSKKLMGKWEM